MKVFEPRRSFTRDSRESDDDNNVKQHVERARACSQTSEVMQGSISNDGDAQRSNPFISQEDGRLRSTISTTAVQQLHLQAAHTRDAHIQLHDPTPEEEEEEDGKKHQRRGNFSYKKKSSNNDSITHERRDFHASPIQQHQQQHVEEARTTDDTSRINMTKTFASRCLSHLSTK